MSLYIFRHAEAFQIGEIEGLHDDFDRPLTPKGKSVTVEVCKGLKRLDVFCDRIWHSPLLRAVETARIIAREMNCGVVEEKEGLGDSPNGEELFRSLSSIDPKENLFVVGHQPDLGEWVARLATGAKAEVSLSKSGVACLDLTWGASPPRAMLRWLMRDKHLRMIGKKD